MCIFLFSKLKPVKLAWVTAQIHCQCAVSESRVPNPVDAQRNELSAVSSETSFVPFKGHLHSIFPAQRSDNFLEWYLSSYLGHAGRLKRFWSKVSNSKTVRDRLMGERGADRNPWAGYRMGLSRTPISPFNPKAEGLKSPPLKLQPSGWRSLKMSIEHV